jgi:hypothetical protein
MGETLKVSRPLIDNGPRVAVVVGDGAFEFPIVGESHYQDNIERIAGKKTERGVRHRCAAVLSPEPTNPQRAIRIDVENRTVGYLSRDVAGNFLAALSSNGFTAAVAGAVIVGGWDRGKGDVGSFGVKLDAAIPFSLAHPNAQADQTEPDRSEKEIAAILTPSQEEPSVAKKSHPWIAVALFIFLAVVAFNIFGGNSKANKIAEVIQTQFVGVCETRIEGLFSDTLRLDWTASTTKFNSITVMAAIGNSKSSIYDAGIRYLKFPNNSGGYNIIDWKTGEKTSVSESARYYFP